VASEQYLLDSIESSLRRAEKCIRSGDEPGLEKSMGRMQRYIHDAGALPASSRKSRLLKSYCSLVTCSGTIEKSVPLSPSYQKMEEDRVKANNYGLRIPYPPKPGAKGPKKMWPVDKPPKVKKSAACMGKGKEKIGVFTGTVGKKKVKDGKFSQQGGLTHKSLAKKKSTKLKSEEGGLTKGKTLMKKSLRDTLEPTTLFYVSK
jgi:hypothetical protein